MISNNSFNVNLISSRLREQAGLTESHNLDLTFSVLFNLANQYANNEMYTEALNTYQVRIFSADLFNYRFLFYYFKTVLSDLVKFHHFGKFLKVFGNV